MVEINCASFDPMEDAMIASTTQAEMNEDATASEEAELQDVWAKQVNRFIAAPPKRSLQEHAWHSCMASMAWLGQAMC